jgi:hypothetical protein
LGAHPPIPNPQSPIPNPHSKYHHTTKGGIIIYLIINKKINLKMGITSDKKNLNVEPDKEKNIYKEKEKDAFESFHAIRLPNKYIDMSFDENKNR